MAPGADLRLAARPVLLEGLALAPERLHDAHARKTLLQRCQGLGDTVANRAVGAPGAVVEAPAREDEDRERDERDRRQRGRENDQGGDRQRDLQRAAGDLDERLADELRQRLDVGRQPRDQHPGALALEEAERQGLQLVECGRPQRTQEPLACSRRQEDLRTYDQRLRQGEGEERDRGGIQRRAVVLLDACVHGVADERRPRECDQRRNDDGERRADVLTTDGPNELTRVPPDDSRRGMGSHAASSSPSASSSRWRPSSMMRPPSSTATRSARATVAGRCAITSVVRPAITFASAARTSCSFVASTAEVASSRTRTAGSARMVRAIAMRCRWPPESEKPRSPSTVA